MGVKQTMYLNPEGFARFDPSGPTLVRDGVVANMAIGATGAFTANLSQAVPNAVLVPAIVDGAADGQIMVAQTSDTTINIATETGGVAADRTFQLLIFSRGPQ